MASIFNIYKEIFNCTQLQTLATFHLWLVVSKIMTTLIIVVSCTSGDLQVQRRQPNRSVDLKTPSKTTCSICSTRLNTEQSRDEHVNGHDKMKYICPTTSCHCLFETFKTLIDHCRHSHGTLLGQKDEAMCIVGCISSAASETTKRHKCELCQREFLSKPFLDYHTAHHSEMTHQCPQPCGFVYEDYASLVKHYLCKHGSQLSDSDESLYRVNTNGDTENRGKLAKDQNIKPVLKIGKIGKDRNMKSVLEKAKFRKDQNIDLKSVPQTGVPANWSQKLICKICQRKFTNVDRKNNHESNHNKMVYKCTCGSMYRDFKMLRTHNYWTHKLTLAPAHSIHYKIKPTLTFVRNAITKRWSTKAGSQKENKKKCHLCNRQLRTKLNYDHHLAHHKEMVYQCPSPCGHMFMYFHRLKKHAMDVHKLNIPADDEQKFRAKQSGETIEEPKTRTWSEELTCQICKRKFMTKERKDRHLAQHDSMVYICPQTTCDNLFLDFSSLQKHSLASHNKRLLLTRKVKYRIKSGMSNTRKKENQSGDAAPDTIKATEDCTKPLQANLQCSLCGRNFRNATNKYNHVSNHSKMVFQCLVPCGNKYLSFNLFQKHCLTCHGKRILSTHKDQFKIQPGSSPFGDKICRNDSNKADENVASKPKPGPNVNQIRKHFPNKTPGSKHLTNKSECHICQRLFLSKKDLVHHVTHHQKMIYECPEPCGYRYLEFVQLRQHSLKAHGRGLTMTRSCYRVKSPSIAKVKSITTKDHRSNNNKNICHICHRRFLIVADKDYHVLHHEEMQYQCPHPCGKMFMEFSDFKSHVRNAQDTHGFRVHQEDKERYTIKRDIVQQGDEKERSTSVESTEKSFQLKLNVLQASERAPKDQEEEESTSQHKQAGVPQQDQGTKATVASPCNQAGNKRTSDGHVEIENKRPCGEQSKDKHKPLDKYPKYKCPVVHPACGSEFYDFKILYDHCQAEHSIKLNNDHEEMYSIKKQRLLNQNSRCPRKDNRPRCKFCQRMFNTEAVKDDHVSKHDQMKFRCPECGALYEEMQALRQHCQCHKLKLSKMDENRCLIDYQEHNSSVCSEGNISVKSEDEEKKTTTNEIMFVCGLCNRLFSTEEDRNLHVRHHEQLVFRCPAWQCSYSYLDMQSLKRHIASNHSFTLDEDEEEYCRLNHRVDTLGKPSSGRVIQSDGNQVGEVDVHTNRIDDETGTYDQKTRMKPVIAHPGNSVWADDSTDEPMIYSTISLNTRRDIAVKQLVDDITCRLVAEILCCEDQQHAHKESIPLHIMQSPETDNIQKQENCATLTDTSIAQDVQQSQNELDSTLDMISTILETDLLDHSFNSDLLENLLSTEDDPKQEADVEPIKITSCYSLSHLLTNHDENAEEEMMPEYDVQNEHSYALPRQASLPGENASLEGNTILPTTSRKDLSVSTSMGTNLPDDLEALVENLAVSTEIPTTVHLEMETAATSGAGDQVGSNVAPNIDVHVSADSGIDEHAPLDPPVTDGEQFGSATTPPDEKNENVHSGYLFILCLECLNNF